MSSQQAAYLTIHAIGIALHTSLSGDFASQSLRHRVRRRRARWSPAPSCRATRLDRAPREHPSPIKECGTPVATAPSRTMSRLQPCVATDWEILLRPRVGEGRNTMLKRGRCASPVSVSVHGRLSSSKVIEEQNEEHHPDGEEPPASRRAL